MLSYTKANVTKILYEDENITKVEIETEGISGKAINYNKITGKINLGDTIIINTTAIKLSLGTGGYHFVIYNHSNKSKEYSVPGHIMKLRYTPLQLKCMVVEEQGSQYHERIKNFKDLNKSIVAVGTLHSMLAPIAATIKWLRPELRVNYIMTDGGALPIYFSDTVKILKDKGIIDNTITIGHSFGGDYECVNIYTGLITAKEILNSDVTIVTMGPGIVGTNTEYGFSGIEQGYILDAVNNLKGLSFAIPRISFSDYRNRHKGISHHTITNLCKITCTSSILILPILEDKKLDLIKSQVEEAKLNKKHKIIYEDGKDIKKALDYYNLEVSTMGRSIEKDRDYFISLGAVAKGIVNYLECHQ